MEPPEILEPDLDQPRIDNAMTVMRETEADKALALSQHEAAVRAVAVQVGYQLPADWIDPDLIQRDISANMRRSVEACLEVGRGLTVLKAACPHGNFIARLDVLGIEQTVATRFMQTARKFSNVATSQLLKAAGNQSKLFEMLVLDDEQVEELELTGQTGELKLDEIATMSVKELRAALREARADGQAKDELLADKNKLLDDERAKSKRIKTIPPDEQLAELLKEAGGHLNAALGAINGGVRQAFVALSDFQPIDREAQDVRPIMAGHIAQLQQILNELREEFMLPDHVGDGTPEWMRATAGDSGLQAA